MNDFRERDRKVEDSATARVAVLGDSRLGVEALQSRLVEEGFGLFSGDDDADAAGALPSPPDVVVFDIADLGIPEQVEAMLRDCRSRWSVPILCLLPPSEHATPRTIARLAADDFLFKPPRALEIRNRIQLLLQRPQPKRDSATRERRGRNRRKADRRTAETVAADAFCKIDEKSKSVRIEGRTLNLSPREYEMLRLLCANPGRILSAQEIIAGVWRGQERASVADVHQYVHMLRRKIESDPKQPRWIVTVRGFGYKLEIPSEA